MRGLVFAGFAACLAAGCGATVYVPDTTEGPGGAGGSGGAGGFAGAAGSGTTSTCALACTTSAKDTCSCGRDCGAGFTNKVSCAPITDLQGNHKIQCVCTVAEQFSGVCFEKHEDRVCDFDLGCCAKYFSNK